MFPITLAVGKINGSRIGLVLAIISPLINLSFFCLIQSNGLKVFESIPGPMYVGVSRVSDPTISLMVLLVR